MQKYSCVTIAAVSGLFLASSLLAQPASIARILLPERTRLLQGQLVDLVIELVLMRQSELPHFYPWIAAQTR